MNRLPHGPALALLAGLAVLSLACSSMQVSSDWDPRANFAQLRTWSWSTVKQPEGGSDPRVTTFTHERIRAAIEEALAERGYHEIRSGTPDFFVGYQIAIERKLDVDEVYRSYGAGPYYGGWGGNRVYAKEYDEGTLVIDVLKSAPMSLIWRGTAQSRVHLDADPQQREQHIREAVDRVLERFPPAGPKPQA
jgi:hypothetical protein